MTVQCAEAAAHGVDRGHTYSEQYRHECEVRYVLAMPSREQRAEYLDSLVRKRSAAAAERLRQDVACGMACSA